MLVLPLQLAMLVLPLQLLLIAKSMQLLLYPLLMSQHQKLLQLHNHRQPPSQQRLRLCWHLQEQVSWQKHRMIKLPSRQQPSS